MMKLLGKLRAMCILGFQIAPKDVFILVKDNNNTHKISE